MSLSVSSTSTQKGTVSGSDPASPSGFLIGFAILFTVFWMLIIVTIVDIARDESLSRPLRLFAGGTLIFYAIGSGYMAAKSATEKSEMCESVEIVKTPRPVVLRREDGAYVDAVIYSGMKENT